MCIENIREKRSILYRKIYILLVDKNPFYHLQNSMCEKIKIKKYKNRPNSRLDQFIREFDKSEDGRTKLMRSLQITSVK